MQQKTSLTTSRVKGVPCAAPRLLRAGPARRAAPAAASLPLVAPRSRRLTAQVCAWKFGSTSTEAKPRSMEEIKKGVPKKHRTDRKEAVLFQGASVRPAGVS
jgi:hypothetical protein